MLYLHRCSVVAVSDTSVSFWNLFGRVGVSGKIVQTIRFFFIFGDVREGAHRRDVQRDHALWRNFVGKQSDECFTRV